jgi:ectoine hydroxylase-related dioxygenase (phytanoyl-CoA dioxygenase family)
MATPLMEQQSAEELRSFYEENGYLVVRDALTLDEVNELRAEAVAICRGERGVVQGGVPAELGETDDDVMSRYLCIHHAHKISDVMLGYMSHPAIVRVLTSVIGPNVKCMQSMLFIKSAGKPGQAWHQDEDFIPTRDRSLIGGWIALDEATTENGCLWVIPGSHKPGILWQMQMLDDPDFDCAPESFGYPYTDDQAVPVEVGPGSLVFFNGYILHRSLPNRAKSGYRRALVNHYMSAESLLAWSYDLNLAQADYRDIVMVTGSDPYAYKGLEHRVDAQLRFDREGGCQWIGETKPVAEIG